MKIIILAIGKEKDFGGFELVSEYTGRISHYYPCEWKYIGGIDQQTDNKNLIAQLEKFGSSTYVVALDEKGKEFDSRGFAQKIEFCLNVSVRTLIFIIGGSYGLNDEVRTKAHLTLALSKLTFPHQLVRLVLIEQIYRACSIIRGEKYHH